MITSSEKARQLFEGLVGRRSGIVQQVARVATIDGDAALEHVGARIANTHPSWSERGGLQVGGSGQTIEEALCAALGEAVERYAASAYPARAIHRARARELSGRFLVPALFTCFSDEQYASAGFPFRRPLADDLLGWVEGRSLRSGALCHVPAFAVYVAYRLTEGEPLVMPGLSTGLCCASTREEAILGGICEVIERDAVAICWLKGISPPRIDANALMEHAGDLLPPFDRATAYDLTTDLGVPVVFIVCIGQGPAGPLVSVGSACHPDWRTAVRKAAREVGQDRVYVRTLIAQDPDWQPAADFSNVTDFSLHARLYSSQPGLAQKAFAFLDENPRISRLRGAPEISQEGAMLNVLSSRLEAHGLPGAWVDLTPPWAAELELHVVKALIPGLVGLHGHHRLAFLGHPRVRDWGSAMPQGEIHHHWLRWPYPHPCA